MAIDATMLRDAAGIVAAAPTLRDAIAQWREKYPGVRAIQVDTSDMSGEAPALTLGQRDLYFASTNGHCWSITRQPDEADALILTER